MKTEELQETSPRRRQPSWIAKGQASPSADRYFSRSIERALDVFEVFNSGRLSLNLKEIARLTKQPEASLYRILLTLQKRGYLQQNQDGSYFLAPKASYGRQLDEGEMLKKVAYGELQRLHQAFNETASLSFVFGNYAQILETIESSEEIKMTNQVGRIIPPHCSAMAKAIVANRPPDIIQTMLNSYGLARRTPHTIVDRGELMKEFATIRKQRYAVDREESALGGICYAAAIFSEHGVVGALSVSTPLSRLTTKRETVIRKAVVESAAAVTSKLQK